MKNELKFILTCDYAGSGENQKLNAMGIFTKIFTKALPTLHPQFYIVLSFETSKGKHKIKLTGPQEELIGETEVESPSDNYIINQIFALQNVIFNKLGKNKFTFSIDGKKIGEETIDIILKD